MTAHDRHRHTSTGSVVPQGLRGYLGGNRGIPDRAPNQLPAQAERMTHGVRIDSEAAGLPPARARWSATGEWRPGRLPFRAQ